MDSSRNVAVALLYYAALRSGVRRHSLFLHNNPVAACRYRDAASGIPVQYYNADCKPIFHADDHPDSAIFIGAPRVLKIFATIL